jgi:predicted lipoprotein with Yx(FWY)xxD motif
MKRTSILIITAALALAACGSDDEEQTTAPAAATTSLVTVGTVDGTDVLVDGEGRTLYTAPVEEDGIRCVDACESFWAPTLASAADAEAAASELDAELDVVERPTGDQQLTFNGLPLYTFTEEDAGQLEGDGFVDDFQGTHFEWEAAQTRGGSRSPRSSSPSDDGPGGGYGY